MSHSSGPWAVSANFHQNGNILDDQDNVIANIPYAETDSTDLAKSNADLIMAAPEMLDTLERIVKVANGSIADKVECIAKMAEIAIAKAKGS